MDGDQLTNSLVYLIHIQKTAGTSIRFYFEKGFGANKCLWHAPNVTADNRGNLFNIAASDPSRFDTVRATGGHIGFSKIPKPIKDRDPIFVSALRNPVSRIVSHYEHIRKAAGHGLHDQVANRTLFQALQSRGFAAMSDRVQIEYLCGGKDMNALGGAMAKHKYIIGKQERIDDLFRLLSATFRFPVFADVCVNVGKPGYERDIESQPDYEDAVALIKQMNKEEYEFYRSFEGVWSNV